MVGDEGQRVGKACNLLALWCRRQFSDLGGCPVSPEEKASDTRERTSADLGVKGRRETEGEEMETEKNKTKVVKCQHLQKGFRELFVRFL